MLQYKILLITIVFFVSTVPLRAVDPVDSVLSLEFETIAGTSPATTPNDGSSTQAIEVLGTAALETTTHYGGSSLVFDGATTRLRAADSDDWNVIGSATDDWTIDFWMKHAVADLDSGHEAYVCHYQDSSRIWCLVNQGTIRFVASDGAITALDTGYTPGVNDIGDTEWHHIALVKVGVDYGVYLDGELIHSVTNSFVFEYDGDLVIGYQPANGGTDYLEGNMDLLRISKGNVFRADPAQSGNRFPVPVADSVLSLDFEEVDSGTSPPTTPNDGTNTDTVDVHGPATVSSSSYVGDSSLFFNGFSTHLSVADSEDWNVVANSTDDWTIDFWMKHAIADLDSGHEAYVCHYEDSSRYWCLVNQGTIRFVELDGSIVAVDTGYTPGVNDIGDTEWHHIALIKVQDDYGIYLDGQLIHSVNDGSVFEYDGDLVIGYQPANGGTDYLEGNMDLLRITKGNLLGADPSQSGDQFDLTRLGVDARCASTPAGIVGWWTGDSDGKDRVNANHGTLINDAQAGQTGNVSGAFLFDGIDDYVNIPDSDLLDLTTEITVMAWFRVDGDTGNNPSLVAKWSPSGAIQQSYELGLTRVNATTYRPDFVVSLDGETPPTRAASSSQSITLGDGWHLMAGTFKSDADGTRADDLQVYLDGQLQGSTDLPQGAILQVSETPMVFGQENSNLIHPLDGQIDEVILFDRELSASEIQRVYLAGCSGICKRPSLQLSASDATACDGLSIDVQLSNPENPVDGLSFGLAHATSELTAVAFELSATAAALNAGEGPGFLSYNLNAYASDCTTQDAGVTVGLIVSRTEPPIGDLVWPIGVNQDLLRVEYDLAPGVLLGDELSVDFAECLRNSPGGDLVPSLVIVGSQDAATNLSGTSATVVPCFSRGDCNQSGSFNIGDPIRIIGFLFLGQSSPSCADACDTNDDGDTDVTDVVVSLNRLFLGGSPLPPPFGFCGTDPSTDLLPLCVFDSGVCP